MFLKEKEWTTNIGFTFVLKMAFLGGTIAGSPQSLGSRRGRSIPNYMFQCEKHESRARTKATYAVVLTLELYSIVGQQKLWTSTICIMLIWVCRIDNHSCSIQSAYGFVKLAVSGIITVKIYWFLIMDTSKLLGIHVNFMSVPFKIF